MFAFLTSDSSSTGKDPLTNDAAADHFARSLPLDDPLGTLGALSEALATLPRNPDPSPGQLNVLLTLDRRTEKLHEELLVNSVDRGSRSWPPDSAIWDSLLDLSRAFGRAYAHFLRHIRERTSSGIWLDFAPVVLVQLFRHRNAEGLLSLFRYEQLASGWWRDLYDAYRFAQSRDLAARRTQAGRGGPAGTLDSLFIQILLLQLMNSGQFMPREAFWAREWLSVWCDALSLQPGGGTRKQGEGFVVDLNDTDGLKRPASQPMRAPLYLDSTPLLALIDQQVTALRGSAAGVHGRGSAAHPAQLALLAKLRGLFSSKPVHIERRGERKAVALMTAQVVAGLPSIIRTLHEEWRMAAAASRVPVTDEITITDVSGPWRAAGVIGDGDFRPSPISLGDASGGSSPTWRVKDRSDSGTLLRGRVDDIARMLPGSLIVLRDRDDSQWTIAVIRRLRRLLRNNIEIGVEHIGRKPQGVTIVAEREPSRAPTSEHQDSYAAIFLRESARFPKLAIKTLLLPAREFKPGRVMTLLSPATRYTLRVKEPLEAQAEFVWTTFEVIKKQSAGSPAAVR
ncbi:MAG TPA: hypothetical protein VMQ50_17185 [Casimicrobiaceae bacterium]|nr:hypothetical protein [Casimicrobiaceae bacterium]